MASPSTPASDRGERGGHRAGLGDRRRAGARIRIRAWPPVPFLRRLADYGRSATARPAATVRRPACSTSSVLCTRHGVDRHAQQLG